jgi:hypothetical protein
VGLLLAKTGFNSILVRLKVFGCGSIVSENRFQFHTGSIKSPNGILDDAQVENVSIPYWFD